VPLASPISIYTKCWHGMALGVEGLNNVCMYPFFLIDGCSAAIAIW
jgi:hypothetical protein